MQACIVGLSLRLGDSRSVGSSAGRGIAAMGQRGGGRHGDGLGDSSVLVNRDLSLLVAPSKANAILEKFGSNSGSLTSRNRRYYIIIGTRAGYQNRCYLLIYLFYKQVTLGMDLLHTNPCTG